MLKYFNEALNANYFQFLGFCLILNHVVMQTYIQTLDTVVLSLIMVFPRKRLILWLDCCIIELKFLLQFHIFICKAHLLIKIYKTRDAYSDFMLCVYFFH